MHNPLVSVIIPNYCHARYLDQRIQSVLNQTYQNFEVIILDDCSPDDGASRAVIEKYRDNPHVSHIVYNTENSGSPFKQWHKGIGLAKGELIWIAESDDYADERLLEALVPQFEVNDNVSVVFCRTIEFDEDGVIGPAYPLDIQESVYDGKEFIRRWCILKAGIVNASCAIFTRNAFNDISDVYTTFKGAADKLFWVEIAECGDVAFVDKPYNYFRQHKKNSTKGLTESGINQIEDKRIFDYLCQKGHIVKEDRNSIKWQFIKRNVFEMIESKKLKRQIYEVWGFNFYQQILMRIQAWIEKLI